YPGATEYCNGEDDDCDGSNDNNATDALSWYTDADGDGYGSSAQLSCTQPSGTVVTSGDCNDSNAAISPAATEICDALDTDEDCDGLVEDADPSLDLSTQTTWYTDADGDGYGTGLATPRCEGGSSYASSSTDCNDGNAAISPGDAEVCDSADTDEDCDGTGDEQGAVGCLNFYVDADGDGYGGSTYACLCSASGSYTASANDDCDDALLAVYPGAEEVSDGIDNDCDGTVDELGQEWTLAGNYTIDWFVQRTSAGAVNHPLGEFFASGKDVTGDGIPDLLLGDTDGNASGGGLIYLYRGPFLRTTSSYVSTYGAASDYIGPVAMLDDQNGDAVADVLIGGDGVGTRGGAYIISGAAWTSSGTVSTRAYVAISGSGSTTSAAGFVVAAAGDVFGDGTSDMIIGQTVNSYRRLHVEDGPISSNKSLAGTVSFTSPNLSDSFGSAIAAEGDLNGDGLSDMVFGVYNAPSGGVVWVHYGATGLSGAVTTGTGSDAIRTATATTGDLGQAVDILPDLNNDGYDELAMGDGYLKAAYIEFGSPTSGSMSVSSSDIIISSTTVAGFGRSLSNAGDLDGDGQEDFAIGANAQLFVYYDVVTAGSYDAETSAAVVVDSSNYATVGTHVGPAGDMDNDGIDDLMVPCPTLAYATSYGARTYLLSGGLSRVGVPAA
ncbi:MAG TPA: putative metal-binding motif-containing protein, partial [Myxococcota bacterium]|nr:putative metal-binding motif-containing protein [Myxococcota bacterium]